MMPPHEKAKSALKAGQIAGRRRSEFAIIEDYFAPLTQGDPLAYALKDDAAIIHPMPGMDLVVTVDGMVAGVHFLPDDPPEEIAQKLLRVNLSDLAAKGAEPLSYVLTCAWPRDLSLEWIERFAQGLSADQKRFGIHLIGGDTVATDGPLTLSLTAFGQTPEGSMIRRGGARPGDVVCVSGAIGDGAAGLRIARGEACEIDAAGRDYLLQRYRRPEPHLGLGQALRGIAHACADVSDGLLADAAHIGQASGVRLVLQAAKVPLSASAQSTGLDRVALITGGDDYELLFTLDVKAAGALSALSIETGVALNVIGRVDPRQGTKSGACLLNEQGREIEVAEMGYQHF